MKFAIDTTDLLPSKFDRKVFGPDSFNISRFESFDPTNIHVRVPFIQLTELLNQTVVSATITIEHHKLNKQCYSLYGTRNHTETILSNGSDTIGTQQRPANKQQHMRVHYHHISSGEWYICVHYSRRRLRSARTRHNIL